MKQRVLSFCTALLVLCTLAGCAQSSNDYSTGYARTTAEAPETAYDGGYYDDVEFDMMYDEEEILEPQADAATGGDIGIPIPPFGGEADLEEIADQPRKIVYTVNVSLQTLVFDEGVLLIPTLAESVGGFVQDSYIQNTDLHQNYYNRTATFTLRVPIDSLDAVVDRLSIDFHLVSQQKSSNDITANYYDIQARLDSLRIQQERLTAMLENASELQYMLDVERELADVLYQIERLTTSLNRMDNQVNYSTVTVYLEEVSAYEDNLPGVMPVTFGERISEALGDSWIGFVRFWQNLLLLLIALLPFLPILLIILIVVVLLVRRGKKKGSKPSGMQHPSIYSVPPQTKEPGESDDPNHTRDE